MAIKLLIADDHGIIREGLIALLDKHPDMNVVGQAKNGREAVEMAQKLQPDIILMDITMPDLNGIDATKKIIQQNTNMKVIALSIHSANPYVSDMIKAGASGYVLKDSLFDELSTAVQTVADGDIYLSPNVASAMVDDYIDHLGSGDSSNLSRLSDKESQTLQMIANGKKTRQIAEEMKVSPKTVESYRRNIMDKLEIYSIAELTKFAIRQGLTSVES